MLIRKLLPLIWALVLLMLSVDKVQAEPVDLDEHTNGTRLCDINDIQSTYSLMPVVCMRGNRYANCLSPLDLRPGTKVKIACKPGFFILKDMPSVTCLDSGIWQGLDQLEREDNEYCSDDCLEIHEPANPLSINGYAIKTWQAPWTVAIYHKRQQSTIYKCAGSLVRFNFVITAAHCLFKYSRAHINTEDLRVGYLDQQYEVKDYKIYPGYAGNGIYDHDIAILKLKQNIRPAPNQITICLPWFHKDLELSNESLTEVSGWSNGTLVEMIVQVTTRNTRTGSFEIETSGDTKLCRGDGGSPVYKQCSLGEKKGMCLIGVVSSINTGTENSCAKSVTVTSTTTEAIKSFISRYTGLRFEEKKFA